MINHEAQANTLLDLLLDNKAEEFNIQLSEYLNQIKEQRIKRLQSTEIKNSLMEKK